MKSNLSINISKKDFLTKILKGKNIALIFQKPSTRTRVSFEKLYGNVNDLELAIK